MQIWVGICLFGPPRIQDLRSRDLYGTRHEEKMVSTMHNLKSSSFWKMRHKISEVGISLNHKHRGRKLRPRSFFLVNTSADEIPAGIPLLRALGA